MPDKLQQTKLDSSVSVKPFVNKLRSTNFSTNILAIIALIVGVNLGNSGRLTHSSLAISDNSAQSLAPPAQPDASNIIVGAGDIGRCDTNNDEATAKLLDAIPGTVYTLGDNVYSDGTAAEFRDCYDPTWGRHKARTRPASGNHDYHVAGAAAYYDYFGAAAGDRTKGYYSYNIDNWHIIVLNTECAEIGGCGATSPQVQWLKADLAANPSSCLLAYWHKPRFSSGYHGNSSAPKEFWPVLYAAGADVILNGHDHEYERFALQDPNGSADPVNGIRQFVVGTGGTTLVPFSTIAPNSEVRNASTFGVLKLTLNANSYEWQFVPVAGSSFTDSGTGSCRGNEPTATPTTDGTVQPGATHTSTPTPSGTAANTPTFTPTLVNSTLTPPSTPSEVCASGLQSFSQRINIGTDDAEEALNSGAVDTGSSDLELVSDSGSVQQIVGMRFSALAVPQGATIKSATIEFEVDEVDSTPTSLLFQAQAADNPPAFSSANHDLSSRPRTNTQVPWENVPAWAELNAKQQTPNLAALVQEVVGRDNWNSGNAIVFLVTGSGKRTAEAFEGEQAATPRLTVNYCLDEPSGQTPTSTPPPTQIGNNTYLPLVTR